jgi:3'-5' exoribonuclease
MNRMNGPLSAPVALSATVVEPPHAFAPGARVDLAMRVVAVEQRDSDRGGFTTLTLSTRAGRISTSPFWQQDLARLDGISPGSLVRVVGRIGQFRGRRQLNVGSVVALPPGAVDWRDLLPAIDSAAPYWTALDRWRGTIRAPRLAHTLDLFFSDADFRHRFEACPASTAGHHAELGGLLRHTWEVAAIALAIARTCCADRDLVTAGALLHDIGKLEAYRWDGAFETTEAGFLLGHVTLGMLMLDRRLRHAEEVPCTPGEERQLQHLIASHHGRQEFGAAVAPMTLEAEILHYADNASAKSATMARALADAGNFEGDAVLTSRPVWELDHRRAFRGRSDWGREVERWGAGAEAGKTERPPSRG